MKEKEEATHVELLGAFGDDIEVVNAARVSMAKESDWEAFSVEDDSGALHIERRLSKADAKLIKYLSKNGHWKPFSHVILRFRFKMPIFIARQWYRHEVGFSRNEVSRRYVSAPPVFYMPDAMRLAAEHIKQGSSDQIHESSEGMLGAAERLCDRAAQFYEMLIADGVAPEQARMFLPQNMMTEFRETASLYAYARLCRERLHPHAQKEIRDYAELVSAKCAEIAPASWSALMGDEV